MKIGIIITHCKKNKASRYVIEISKYFVEENEVHVFTNEHDPLDERVEVHKIPMFLHNSVFGEMSFTLLSSILANTYPLDIKLAQPTRFFSPNVCEMQVVYREWAKTIHPNPSLSLRLTLTMEKFNLQRTKKVIAISGRVKQDVLRNYPFVDEEDVHVVYSGVDLDFFNPLNRKKFFSEIRNRHGIPETDKIILFAGNPFSLKGLDNAVKSVAKLKQCKLIICGNDDPLPYQKLAKKLGITDRIIFAGFRSDIQKYFAASDVFLFPTNYDAFGLVALEAMASGLPVLSSKEAGVTEIIDDGKDGFRIDPQNVNSITDRLNYLLKNESVRMRMRKKARKKAENYSWRNTAMKMLKVFQSTV